MQSKLLATQMNILNFKGGSNWTFKFINRNNLSIRCSRTVGQNLTNDWKLKMEKFRTFIRNNIADVEALHLGNMNKVPVSFVLPPSRTVYLKGSKEVFIATTGQEKTNFTVMLCVTSNGSKLTPVFIFKKKKKCQKRHFRETLL